MQRSICSSATSSKQPAELTTFSSSMALPKSLQPMRRAMVAASAPWVTKLAWTLSKLSRKIRATAVVR